MAMQGHPPTEDRTCDQCGKPIEVPPDAPHKRFCDAICRNRFHRESRHVGEAAKMALKGAA